MRNARDLESISDDVLLRRLSDLLRQSRRTEADLVAHIGEVDARRLYAREALPSMFAYCTEILHLSDAEGYLRIAAARASREHPVLLEMLADRRLHLTAVAKLAPHLTPESREALLERAVHRSKRQIEELVAEIAPRPDAPTLMCRLPARRLAGRREAPADSRLAPEGVQLQPALGLERAASTDERCRDAAAAAGLELGPDGAAATGQQLRPDGVAVAPTPGRVGQPAVVEPLAPARYKIQFTASAELHDKLERLRALMRSSVPDGDLARIIERAVTEKLERLEARRYGRTLTARKARGARPTSLSGRPDSPASNRSPSIASPPETRHIPAAVRRAVYERDEGRCRFVDERGRRCTAREGLEFHHRHPFGFGGEHSVANVSLQCRAHNRRLAEADYGRVDIARHGRSATCPVAQRASPWKRASAVSRRSRGRATEIGAS